MSEQSDAPVRRSIAFVGQFNPVIVQPRWLASIGVLELEEADEATPPLISPELTLVRTPRLLLQVTHERALLQTGSEVSDPSWLSETTQRLFAELPHTPISGFDLVHEAHIISADFVWGDLAAKLIHGRAVEALVEQGELQSIEIGRNRDGEEMLVVLEPSLEKERAIYVRVQRGYQVEDNQGVGSAGRAMTQLNAAWPGVVEDMDNIVSSLHSLK
jgi:hypothetical protein